MRYRIDIKTFSHISLPVAMNTRNRPNTSKPNFIEYLDTVQYTQTDYYKMADLLHLSHMHYTYSFFHDPSFCGMIKPSYNVASGALPSTFSLWEKQHEHDCIARTPEIGTISGVRGLYGDNLLSQDTIYI